MGAAGTPTFTLPGTGGGGGSPTGPAGGDLSGTYPNPGVAKINGNPLGSTTPTDANLLIANGTQWVTQAMSGDATISDTGVVTFASVIAAGGPTGSPTVVPVITWDAKGRLTVVGTSTIVGPFPPSGAAGGDLAGTYPNPSVFQAHLTDQAAPAAPAAGTIILAAFNQQGFDVPHVYDAQGNATEITRDNITVVRNNSGASVSKGQVVYVTGSTGTVPTIALAQANATGTMPAVGVMYDTTANNAFGRMMILGHLENVNMSAFSTGDKVYVSATIAGGLVNVAPSSPNIVQFVGIVINNGVGNGILEIRPTVESGAAGGTLPAGTSNQTLRYNGTSNQWEASSVIQNDATNVVITGNLTAQGASHLFGTTGVSTTITMGGGGGGADNDLIHLNCGSTGNSTLQLSRNGTDIIILDGGAALGTARAQYGTSLTVIPTGGGNSVAFSSTAITAQQPTYTFGLAGTSTTLTVGQGTSGADVGKIVARGGNTSGTGGVLACNINGVDETIIDNGAGLGVSRFQYNGGLTFSPIGVANQQLSIANGIVTKYGNIATVGNGLPAEYATIDLTAQAAVLGGGPATANATLYVVPAGGAGLYRISYYAKVTRVASGGTPSSTLGILGLKWTDATDSTAQSLNGVASFSNAGALQSASGVTGNSLTTLVWGMAVISVAASTTITYGFNYASAGTTSMQYTIHIKVEFLG